MWSVTAAKKCVSEVVLPTTAPRHCCIVATSCRVAHCITHMRRHKSPSLCGNPAITSSESLSITALFFHFSRVMLSRPVASPFALLWMLPKGSKNAAQSRSNTPAPQMLSREEKLFCMSYTQTPVYSSITFTTQYC